MGRKFSERKYNFFRMYKDFKSQFLKFFFLSCGCSFFFAVMKRFLHFFRTNAAYSAVSTVIIIVTSVLFFNWLRDYRMNTAGMNRYFVTNLTAVGIICVGAVIFSLVPFLAKNSLYLFFQFSFFKYLLKSMEFSRISSVLIVSAYYILLVLVTPVITQKHRTIKNQKTRKSRTAYLLNTDTSRDNYSGSHHHHHHHTHHEEDVKISVSDEAKTEE